MFGDPLTASFMAASQSAHSSQPQRKNTSSGSDPFAAPFTIETDSRDYSSSQDTSPIHAQSAGSRAYASEAALFSAGHALLNKSDGFLADSSTFLDQNHHSPGQQDEFASFFSARPAEVSQAGGGTHDASGSSSQAADSQGPYGGQQSMSDGHRSQQHPFSQSQAYVASHGKPPPPQDDQARYNAHYSQQHTRSGLGPSAIHGDNQADYSQPGSFLDSLPMSKSEYTRGSGSVGGSPMQASIMKMSQSISGAAGYRSGQQSEVLHRSTYAGYNGMSSIGTACIRL